jgi:hypothetical protein
MRKNVYKHIANLCSKQGAKPLNVTNDERPFVAFSVWNDSQPPLLAPRSRDEQTLKVEYCIRGMILKNRTVANINIGEGSFN